MKMSIIMRELQFVGLMFPTRLERESYDGNNARALLRNLQRRSPSLSHSMILIPRPAAHANRPHNFPILLQWNPTGKDHDLSII